MSPFWRVPKWAHLGVRTPQTPDRGSRPQIQDLGPLRSQIDPLRSQIQDLRSGVPRYRPPQIPDPGPLRSGVPRYRPLLEAFETP
jgi:hypothetical protein